jgi:hypothetical protein
MTNANPYFQFPYDHFRLARFNTNIVTIFFRRNLLHITCERKWTIRKMSPLQPLPSINATTNRSLDRENLSCFETKNQCRRDGAKFSCWFYNKTQRRRALLSPNRLANGDFLESNLQRPESLDIQRKRRYLNIHSTKKKDKTHLVNFYSWYTL